MSNLNHRVIDTYVCIYTHIDRTRFRMALKFFYKYSLLDIICYAFLLQKL